MGSIGPLVNEALGTLSTGPNFQAQNASLIHLKPFSCANWSSHNYPFWLQTPYWYAYAANTQQTGTNYHLCALLCAPQEEEEEEGCGGTRIRGTCQLHASFPSFHICCLSTCCALTAPLFLHVWVSEWSLLQPFHFRITMSRILGTSFSATSSRTPLIMVRCPMRAFSGNKICVP